MLGRILTARQASSASSNRFDTRWFPASDAAPGYDRRAVAIEQGATWDAGVEDDWFGEGTAFRTEEELAAALFSLAGTLGLDGAPHPAEPSPFRLDDETIPVVPVEHPHLNGRPPAKGTPVAAAVTTDDGDVFEVIDAFEPQPESPRRGPIKVAPPPKPAPLSWGIRPPGVEALPPRQPGRTGWSIRNSVKLLQQIEEVMQRLREDAVVAAFSAAARAMHDLPESYSAATAAPGAARSASRRRISM